MFINLHAHDHGSLLDGIGTPKQRAEQAIQLDQPALSITNHGNIVTAPDHLKACSALGLKPVIGVEAYFKPDRLRQDKNNKKAWHLLLLAKNQQGFGNLIKLISESVRSGFYHRPCVDYELLKQYSDGLICSSACINGYLPWAIQQNDSNLAEQIVDRHLEIFGEDNYYLEIMPHNLPAQRLVNLSLVQVAHNYNLSIIATNDSHYPYADWKDTQDIVLMISTGQTVEQRQRKRDTGEDVYEMDMPLHMFSEEEMYSGFKKYCPDLAKDIVKKAIEEPSSILDKIEEVKIDSSPKLPKVSGKKSSHDLLREWVNEGLKRIGEQDNEIYIDRAKYELKVIEDFGVEDYFIIVAKLVRWARNQGIRISSGRGSAAGSLVCYLIKITTIDPVGHKLMFERFLNPDRKGLPDIDLDFDRDRRQEIVDWLIQEYGDDKVQNIGSFGTYMPRGALKDVSRVLNIPFQEINTVTKVIPDATDVGGSGNIPPLSTLKQDNAFIKEYSENYPEVWKHATRLEGQIRQLSRHAAGVVVSDKPLDDYVPIIKGKTGNVTSWTARAESDIISEMNLLKIDILSLGGLTKQGNTIQIIKETTGEDIDLDELEIARNPAAVDQEVMNLFRKGLTLGIFQFGGGRGIANFLKHTRPDRFEDLVAVNALYRPGALGGGDAFKYGDIKQGKLPVEYWHEAVIPFLEETLGILVFQEQLQQIAQALGNFSPGEADDMRKATSKLYRMGDAKAKEFMSQYYETWINGCKDHGIEEEQADFIWHRLISMGAYTFNKSHSSSYALVSYQDAYLKTYWPHAFYASLLTNEAQEKSELIVREAKQLDVFIKTPDINESNPEFTVKEKDLLYGLRSIKFVGDTAMDEIIEKRPFSSYDDFTERVEKRKVNKRIKDFLVKSGAFDSFGVRDDWTLEQKREGEIEAIGVVLSGSDAILEYDTLIQERCNTEEEFEYMEDGDSLTVGGEITNIKTIKIKRGKFKGEPMAFVDLAFKTNQYECTFFTKQFKRYEANLKIGKPVLIMGRKSDRGQVIANKMITAEKLSKALDV